MKKILAIILALSMLLCFAACGNEKSDDTPSDNSSDISADLEADEELDFEEDEEEDEKALDLQETNIKYVVVALKKSAIKINSVSDFASYTCAYLDGTDSAVWAEYYDFSDIGPYNSPNDLYSGVLGEQFQLGIVADSTAATHSDWEIVWELKAE